MKLGQEVVVVSISVIVLAPVVAGVFWAGQVTPSMPWPEGTEPVPGCLAVGTVSIHGVSYWFCNATLSWGKPLFYGWLAHVTFADVKFNALGYDTIGCQVVVVYGQEIVGVNSSVMLLVTPPQSCDLFPTATEVISDGVWGATWTSPNAIQLLVRSS